MNGQQELPSEFFRGATWANKATLEFADKLNVRISRLDGELEKGYMVEMPGTVEGTSHAAKVYGFGTYTVVEMIVSAYCAGLKK